MHKSLFLSLHDFLIFSVIFRERKVCKAKSTIFIQFSVIFVHYRDFILILMYSNVEKWRYIFNQISSKKIFMAAYVLQMIVSQAW